ncbi:MAG: DUF1674 domain-containing protein [Alphaproteobacteria bacterium]|nr:DUF1674 domain-containing protein [Alphaproteobacteria bacterium]
MSDSTRYLDARAVAEAAAEAIAEKQRRQFPDSATKEFGGPKGLEPTRYGDWEKAGRCFDF